MALSEKELIEIRRKWHQIPEIGMEEFETQKILLSIIEKFPHDFMKIKTWKTAIIVHLTGSKGQTTIGYRTDIDGLPVEEKTGLPFSSKHKGRMHACGHDIHMTVCLGILSYFAEHQPNGCLMKFTHFMTTRSFRREQSAAAWELFLPEPAKFMPSSSERADTLHFRILQTIWSFAALSS